MNDIALPRPRKVTTPWFGIGLGLGIGLLGALATLYSNNFDVTVSDISVDDTILSGQTNYNCDSENIGPGALIVLAAGNRNELQVSDCYGTEDNPIRFVNDTTGNGPTVIRSTGAYDNTLRCTDCQWVEFDGTGKWSGAPLGSCGVTQNGPTWDLGRTQCGIVVKCYSGGGADRYVRLDASTSHFTFKGVEIDGGYPGCDNSAPGIGYSLNDHQYEIQDHPGEWREDFIVTQNYIHDTFGECLYLGPNQDPEQAKDLRLRNNHLSYNLVENCGFDAVELKSTTEGLSTIHHNYVAHSGVNPQDISGNVGILISVYEGGYTDVYSNYVQDSLQATGANDGNCYNNFLQRLQNRGLPSVPNIADTMPTNWYNNVAVDCKRRGFNSGRNSGTPVPNPNVYNNTFVNTGEEAVNAGVNDVLSDCYVRNNVFANTGSISANQCTVSDNITGTVASFDFEDSGADNYHLTSSSSARNQAPDDFPAIDFDGVTRSAAPADAGAYEYVP